MSITFTLPNFPDGQQRTEQTSDGQAPEDGNLDCVPRSIADGLTFLTGRFYNGDELKDAVHGQGWTGFQAASEYVAYCRAQGVLIEPVNGTPTQLVARIHQEIAAGHPVIATIPSLWGLGRDGARADCARRGVPYTTHVICFCGDGPGELRAANPWIPQWHDGTDAYWDADLEDNQIWVMSLLAGEVKMPSVPSGWSDSAKGDPTNNSGVLTAPNGHKCIHGIRAFVLEYPGGWPADNEPIEDEHPQHVMELANAAIPDGVQQAFRRGVVEWIPSDTPGGKGPKAGCFEMWVGAELLATRKALQVAQASLAQEQAMSQTLTQHAADLTNQLAQASLTIQQLQAQIAAALTASAPLTQKQQLEIQIGEAIVSLVKMG